MKSVYLGVLAMLATFVCGGSAAAEPAAGPS